MNKRDELLEMIIKQSYEKREVTLTSGLKSDFYIDCKHTSTDARGAYLIGKLIFERVAEMGLEGVGGLTLGADPIASSVSIVSGLEGKPITAFLIRKERKSHGKMLWIEGGYGLQKGSRVLIVEDVVTTGGSTLKSITRAKDAGFIIEKVITIVDREEGGAEAIKETGCQYESLFTKRDILQVTVS